MKWASISCETLALISKSGKIAKLGGPSYILAVPTSPGAFEQRLGVLIVTRFESSNFRLRRHETTLASGFQDGCTVSRQPRLDTFKGGEPGLKACELFFDFGDNTQLLLNGRDWNRDRPGPCAGDFGERCSARTCNSEIASPL